MNPTYYIFLFCTLLCTSCKKSTTLQKENISTNTIVEKDSVPSKQKKEIIYTNGFDFPIGKPDAKGYYNAQKFTQNNHLGDDWNGINGGNSDLGDPVYVIANGYVTFAEDIQGGWGNVIRITHHINSKTKIESLYAHCDTVLIKVNDFVKKGQQIGTIGTANGLYKAHLHFEIRDSIQMPIGGGYDTNISGYLNPTKFIEQNRN